MTNWNLKLKYDTLAYIPLSDLGISVMLTSERELNLNTVVQFWCQHLKGWGSWIPDNELWGQPGLHSELQDSLGYSSELQVSQGYTVNSRSDWATE